MIAPDGNGGWYITVGNTHTHLTAEWCQRVRAKVLDPNRTKCAAFNRLEWAVRTSQDPDEIYGLFVEATGAMRDRREARKRLGLKAVTRHGDEDLAAVQAGEPVRPWNSTRRDPQLADWIRGQRENRNRQLSGDHRPDTPETKPPENPRPES